MYTYSPHNFTYSYTLIIFLLYYLFTQLQTASHVHNKKSVNIQVLWTVNSCVHENLQWECWKSSRRIKQCCALWESDQNMSIILVSNISDHRVLAYQVPIYRTISKICRGSSSHISKKLSQRTIPIFSIGFWVVFIPDLIVIDLR